MRIDVHMSSFHSDSDGLNGDLETPIKDSIKDAQMGVGMGDNVNTESLGVDNANNEDLVANVVSWDNIDGKFSDN